ncbi:MAG: hypothetical protein JWN38_1159 [Candidatus Saccharibacteria bacterium]|nr:hypothetical protein [Candidatus Saccharibacteria bacterium]
MSLAVAAWNVKSGLGNPETSSEIIAAVDAMDVDVAIFSEAYTAGETDNLEAALAGFRALGYTSVVHAENDDADHRLDRRATMVISRVGGSIDVVRLVSRNAMLLELIDPDTDVRLKMVGAHLDDRRETTRVKQTTLASQLLEGDPALVVGDLNAMPRIGFRQNFLNDLRPLTTRLPYQYPTELEPKISKLNRFSNIAYRLGDMATGDAIAVLRSAGFIDADHRYSPTFKGVAQLDHILVKRGDSEVSAANFQRYPKKKLSDHRAISATILT